MRSRSIKNVFEEIDLLHKKYGIRELYIVDDNFTWSKDFVVELCRELIKRKYDLTLSCPNGVRLDTLDEEMLGLMRRAGWYYLCVGIESGSPRILRDMRKHTTVEKVKEKVALIREAGIDVLGFFILGYPAETREDIKLTIELAKELDLIGAHFQSFHPFPGTEIYSRLTRDGEISESDESILGGSYSEISYSPRGISKRELKKLQRKAIMSFYLRPRLILKNLRLLGSFKHMRFLFKRGSAYLFNR